MKQKKNINAYYAAQKGELPLIKSKKGKACLILILVYVIVGCVIYYREYQGAENIGENAEIEIADSAGNEVPEGKSDPVTEDYVRDFADIRNTLVYADASQTGMYVDSENIQLADVDRESILTLYRLPPLERMDAQDAGTLMAELQVLDRIDALGIDPHVFYTPEYNWKEIYSNSLLKVKESLDFQNRVYFSGASASELNQFMIENVNCVIEIQASELVLDETLRVPSNVIIQGNGVVIAGDSNVDYAIMLERVKNAGVYDVKLSGGFQQGIYVIESSNVLLWKNEITNAVCKAVCVMGDCSSVNLVNNSIYNNGNGAVFFDGNISDCIIEGNSVYENQGTRNLNAGIVYAQLN